MITYVLSTHWPPKPYSLVSWMEASPASYWSPAAPEAGSSGGGTWHEGDARGSGVSGTGCWAVAAEWVPYPHILGGGWIWNNNQDYNLSYMLNTENIVK